MPDRPVVALVDAYGSGRHLRDAFARLGADLVHVSSTPEPLPSLRPPGLDAYRNALVCTDPVRTARELAALGTVAVVAGQEPGVPLADVLSELLDLPTNGSAQSAARRDKYVMIEAVRKAGLRCAEQLRSDRVELIVDWAERLGDYPVVVKPLAASGAEGVSICADAGEVRQAAAAILGTRTMYGQANTEALVQSFLAGTEYIVDTVSCRGRRYTSGVWRYDKRRRGTRKIYHSIVLVPPDDPVVGALAPYVHDVLDAVGVRFGPAHAEVITTPDGPALVEIGARCNGVLLPAFDDACLDANQAQASALAYLRPAEFLTRFAGRTYGKRRDGFVYLMDTDLDGTVARLDDDALAGLAGVNSVRALDVKVRPGGRIRPTVDLPSSPLAVYLANESGADLDRDYRRVLDLSARLFHLA